jgi:hypothetical protein
MVRVKSAEPASADRRRVVEDDIEYEDLRASVLPKVPLPDLRLF